MNLISTPQSLTYVQKLEDNRNNNSQRKIIVDILEDYSADTMKLVFKDGSTGGIGGCNLAINIRKLMIKVPGYFDVMKYRQEAKYQNLSDQEYLKHIMREGLIVTYAALQYAQKLENSFGRQREVVDLIAHEITLVRVIFSNGEDTHADELQSYELKKLMKKTPVSYDKGTWSRIAEGDLPICQMMNN